MTTTLRFRRSIKLAPFVHLNLGMRGAGISIGPRGLHCGISTRNGTYASAGIPGTGLYVMAHKRGQAHSHGVPVWLLLLLALVAGMLWEVYHA